MEAFNAPATATFRGLTAAAGLPGPPPTQVTIAAERLVKAVVPGRLGILAQAIPTLRHLDFYNA